MADNQQPPITAVVMTGLATTGSGDSASAAGARPALLPVPPWFGRAVPLESAGRNHAPSPGADEPMATVTTRDRGSCECRCRYAQDQPVHAPRQPRPAAPETSLGDKRQWASLWAFAAEQTAAEAAAPAGSRRDRRCVTAGGVAALLGPRLGVVVLGVASLAA